MPTPPSTPPSTEADSKPRLPRAHSHYPWPTYANPPPDLPTKHTNPTLSSTQAKTTPTDPEEADDMYYYHTGLDLHLPFPRDAIEHVGTIELPPFTGYLPPQLAALRWAKESGCCSGLPILHPANIIQLGKRMAGGVHRRVKSLTDEKKQVGQDAGEKKAEISAPLKGTGRRVKYYATWG